eukprot:1192857-Rhodomonas_salina.1
MPWCRAPVTSCMNRHADAPIDKVYSASKVIDLGREWALMLHEGSLTWIEVGEESSARIFFSAVNNSCSPQEEDQSD